MASGRIDRRNLTELVPEEERNSTKQNEEFYIIQCPLCIEELNYYKEKLYISKSMLWGYCHRCNTTYQDRHSIFTYPSIAVPNISFMKSYNFKIEFDPSYYYECRTELNQEDIDYFSNPKPEGRQAPFLIPHLNKLGVRFGDNHCIIPYYDSEGKVIYYAKRFYRPKGDMKYFLPPIKKKPYYHIRRNSEVYVICEGQFDAIALSLMNEDYNIIAISGSTMSDHQILEFRNLVPDIVVIYLDKTELSNNLAKLLKTKMPYIQVNVVPSDGTDPEEFLIKKYEAGNF